jgi:hypothetical protein
MAKIALSLALAAFGLAMGSPGSGSRVASGLQPMPADLETRFALSALPAALRGSASVYLLDPEKGYRLVRRGNSGLTCLVERTPWELGELRDDIYIPLCYDSAGTSTYLKVKMDSAKLRAEGITGAALKMRIASLYADKTYKPPGKAGLSYMVAPVMRTIGPPDLRVRTMAMPHLMFYAPGLTNENIGAAPDLGRSSTLLNPFIDRQGNAEQSYMIQLIGEAEKSRILADEKRLVDDLCAYREILCLDGPR